MNDLFSAMVAQSLLQKQMLARRIEQEHWMRLTAEQVARDARCIKNFTDFHGYAPHPAMNMVPIREKYCIPWRKTTIPKVPRRR